MAFESLITAILKAQLHPAFQLCPALPVVFPWHTRSSKLGTCHVLLGHVSVLASGQPHANMPIED